MNIKKCHSVKFSHGGHLLAVGHQFSEELSLDYVRVYNALTLQEMYVYKECQSVVKEVQWKSSDEMLCAVYKDGQVLEWRVSDWSVTRKIVQ